MSGRIAKAVSSWWLTFFLLLCLSASYIYLSFGERPFDGWLRFLFFSSAAIAFYLGLIFNLIAVSIRVILVRLDRQKASLEELRDMDTSVELPCSGDNHSEVIGAWMRHKGFSPVTDGRTITGTKGRFSFLPGTVMRAGLVLLLISLLISMHMRKTDEGVLHEGQQREFFSRQVLLKGIRANLPAEFLSVGEKGGFMLKVISAELISSGRPHTITGGFPSYIDGLYLRIVNIGFFQPFSLKTEQGDLQKDLYLDIFPPGKPDAVTLAPETVLSFSLQPEKTYKKGLLTGKLYNLSNPLYHISLQQGRDRKKTEFKMRPAETLTIGNSTVSSGKKALFVKIQAVYDPALLFIYGALIMLAAGMVMMLSRFFWYEKRISAVIADDRVYIGYREEYFRKWGILRFHKWIKDLRL
ncbi:MAG: hypothetical protein HZA17_12340 [Nitrospirae bacterium]|nr:hypothetical protein [Nitrospirota bacterium]